MKKDKAIKQIKKNGFKYRITSEDSKHYIGICNVDMSRVTLKLKRASS